MRNRDLKRRAWLQWGHSLAKPCVSRVNGYLKFCSSCKQRIYLKKDVDSVWRPYESWLDGKVATGEWHLHDCDE